MDLKKIELFVCEHCGTQYVSEEECRMCESVHHLPKKIVSCEYDAYKYGGSGYPSRVQIEMSDGTMVVYKR